MNLYKGKLVIDLVTAVETRNDEHTMTNEAHDKITSELLDEIQALVSSRGFLIQSTGVTLHNIGEATDANLQIIESSIKEAERKTESIYNKANMISVKFEL